MKYLNTDEHSRRTQMNREAGLANRIMTATFRISASNGKNIASRQEVNADTDIDRADLRTEC